MATFLKCIFGPQLLRLNLRLGLTTDYQAVTAERWGDTVLTSVSVAARILLYTSPIVLPWALRQGWVSLSQDGALFIIKFLAGISMVMVGALFLRTLGRVSNPAYTQFITVLNNATKNYTMESKKVLSQYDFDFSGWPVDWSVLGDLPGDESKPKVYLTNNNGSSFTKLPMDLLAWLLTHSFGISLVYPGSMSLMRMLVERPLMEGRSKLVLENGGERNKVATMDGNMIDTMFVDQRDKTHGSTLVLCCEGNAGFYEIGIMATPVQLGYSVLGWNHPGFYGSTGTPYPGQETLAVDAVMQFAVHKLGYSPENILVFGWSIGGYTATWLGMNYPDIKGLVLDATFDDLLPLAVPRMPAFMSGLVARAVKNNINLGVGDQLAKYNGPVRLVRRSQDEMICTSDGELWSNRGNNLLISLLSNRYPTLLSSLALNTVTTLIYTPGGLDMFQDKEMEETFSQFVIENGSATPATFGEKLSDEEKGRMLCYLATRFMTDLNTTHCTPLPAQKFLLPWDPAVETEFVTVEKGPGDGEAEKDED